jgi:putative transport protein
MIIELLLANPLLLLFLTAGLGYLLGRIKIGGSSLGVAAVLFVGLGFGALHPDMKLPEIIYLLGLVLFVYTIGLSSGPGFFASFRGTGLRDNLFVIGMIGFAALLLVGAHSALGLDPPTTAGLFAGSLTNTPALAGILEYLKTTTPASTQEQILAAPVIAYSLAYPVSVLTMILVIYAVQRVWKIDYAAEARDSRYAGAQNEPLQHRTIRVTQADVIDRSVDELVRTHGWQVVFGRMKRGSQLALVTDQTRLALGDIITVVGSPDALARVMEALGERSDEQIELDRHAIDYRRILVSNPQVAGQRLRDLNLPQQFGAVITRLRRGDIELLPHGDSILQLGDRVRVVTRRENMRAVSTFLGDSYRAVSEIDILSFSLGIALGTLVGLIPIPLPGGVTIRLGLAGGPLMMALILGALGRTGPIVWNLPYSANLVLRQVGLICFLAGVGTRAGYAFRTTLAEGNGLALIGVSVASIAIIGLLTLWIGYRVLGMPMGLLVGFVAGLQTQPATLGFALEQTQNELPNIGYAASFPIAVIVKIVFAQLLLLLR